MWFQTDAVIARREVDWGAVSSALQTYVVLDDSDLLALYVPERAPFEFADTEWPTATKRHPWWPREHWLGAGCLMLQRPEEAYAIWKTVGVRGWYINLQAPLTRSAVGVDTQDFELDIVVDAQGECGFKDADLVTHWVELGRLTIDNARTAFATGDRLIRQIRSGVMWWSDWSEWVPHEAIVQPASLPSDCLQAPTELI